MGEAYQTENFAGKTRKGKTKSNMMVSMVGLENTTFRLNNSI